MKNITKAGEAGKALKNMAELVKEMKEKATEELKKKKETVKTDTVKKNTVKTGKENKVPLKKEKKTVAEKGQAKTTGERKMIRGTKKGENIKTSSTDLKVKKESTAKKNMTGSSLPDIQTVNSVKNSTLSMPQGNSTGTGLPAGFQKRSNTYAGKTFKGYYEGFSNPQIIISIGHDPVKSNAYTRSGEGEYAINRDIAIKLANELAARGIRAGILERETGAKSIDTSFVNSNFAGAKIIELHNNGDLSTAANGVEALISNQEGDNRLGSTIVRNLSHTTGMKLRGNKGMQQMTQGRGGAFVNNLTSVDNSLVEIGFLSNEGDVAKIKQNNGYNVILGLLNGFLENMGLKKADSLLTMKADSIQTQKKKGRI